MAAPPNAAVKSKGKGKGKPAPVAAVGPLRGELLLHTGSAAPSAPVVSTKLIDKAIRQVHVRLDVAAYLKNDATLSDAAEAVCGALEAQLEAAAAVLRGGAELEPATFLFHLPVMQGATSCPFHAVYATSGSKDPVVANTDARKHLHQLLGLPMDRCLP